jgi:hypothetical protein
MTKSLLLMVAVLAGCFFLAGGSAQRHPWKRLATLREQKVWMRHLPSFEDFFQRQFGMQGRLVVSPYFRGDVRGNMMYIEGSLVGRLHPIAGFRAIYFYRGMGSEPSSVEYELRFKPGAFSRTYNAETLKLIRAAEEGGTPRVRWGTMDWSCTKDPEGLVVVKMRTSMPADQMEAIPEYERGDVDGIEFDLKFRVLRFLNGQALLEYTGFYNHLPSYNSPGGNFDNGIGMSTGVLMRKGKAAYLEINVFGATSIGRPRLMLEISTHFIDDKANPEDFFKKEFLALLASPNHVRSFDGEFSMYSGGSNMGKSAITLAMPIDFPIETLKLSDLKERAPDQ